MKKLLIVTTALTGLVAVSAIAASPDFKMADKNGNGAVSFDELILLMPATNKKQFAAADTDKSGDLSKAEYTKATSAK